ncbi:MAG TPA: PHP domain-containing protein, partial [Acidimicrobiales bacterium]|nr:PHP domain-containing protein [Acidimicrobiales bacterium]
MRYAELHCHSNYSFLDGASSPSDLVTEAARLGLSALAITDHNGLYGVVDFAECARQAEVRTVFGAELTLAPGARTGVPDPPGEHIIVLARNPEGYANLSRAIAKAHLAARKKGRPVFTLEDLADTHHNSWVVTTACRKGTVVSALESRGPTAAKRELSRLVDAFGFDNVFVELWNHTDPLDSTRNDALAQIAYSVGVETLATNNVHYATPQGHRLACALGAVRANKSLAEMEGWMSPSPAAHLRSASEQIRKLSRWPGVVERAAELGSYCAFDLKLIAPNLPNFDVPTGHTEQSWLESLTEAGATTRYGPRDNERVPGAWKQIDYELDIIGKLGFPGYFLIVWEIVEFCKTNNVFCQGRGSAANSAVCFALGITRADAVSLGLLFERFLSVARDGPPDIDLDIESGRRDEVIAHVFEKYGRHHAAQVANLITYRPKSAVRDIGRALGCPEEEIHKWEKSLGRGDTISVEGEDGLPHLFEELVTSIIGFPRHLGLHPGGMVICDRPVIDVCPVEWARKEGRTALQWDKESCAAAGLVKIDLLGLGMLEVLHRCVDLIT